MQINLQQTTTTPSKKKKKKEQPEQAADIDNLQAEAINHYYLSTCKYLHSFSNLHQDAVEKLHAIEYARHYAQYTVSTIPVKEN